MGPCALCIPSLTESLPAAPTIAELEVGQRPFVLADSLGKVIRVNGPFCRTYGWREEQLVGQPIGMILPESFRMAHQFGFSRFQATEVSTILAHPLRLHTLCADGQSLVSEHFIVAEKRATGWVFGATLTPLPEGTPTDA
jgi:PAS domain S-box-containing protein